MTPAAIVRLALAALPLVPGMPVLALRIVNALAILPDLIDEMGDGGWTDEDVDILADALRLALAQVPGVPDRHARRIGRGLASAVDLIVSAVRSEPPADRGHGRERARDLLDKARANALPAPSVTVYGREVPR